MDDAPPHSWDHRLTAPMSIIELIAAGTLDAELAALLWLLVEGRLPLVVAAADDPGGSTAVLQTLLAFLPPDVAHRRVGGAGTDAASGTDAAPGTDSAAGMDAAGVGDADPARTYLVASELGGEGTRSLVRATQRGFGLGATVRADSLEQLFKVLEAPPSGLSEDEIRGLGMVLVLRDVATGVGRARARRRIVAAHYLRHLERDMHGHLQRRPPAVLATWDPETDGFEYFAWGVTPELAMRVGATQGDFERGHARRTRFLQGLVQTGRSTSEDVDRALRDFRASEADHAALTDAADDHQRHHH